MFLCRNVLFVEKSFPFKQETNKRANEEQVEKNDKYVNEEKVEKAYEKTFYKDATWFKYD